MLGYYLETNQDYLLLNPFQFTVHIHPLILFDIIQNDQTLKIILFCDYLIIAILEYPHTS